MSKKTIARIWPFVICIALAALFSGCTASPTQTAERREPSLYGMPKVLGHIQSKDIEESSGIAASRCMPDVLWTHNDSGNDAYLFAISTTGETLGTWRVPGSENDDWEDIADVKDSSGKCFIYIGDIGDNKLRRKQHTIYLISEPEINDESRNATGKRPLETATPDRAYFTYPDTIEDAEAMMVHPITKDIYIVTKRISGPANVYKLRPAFGASALVRLEKVGEVSVPAIPNGLITGGDIAPDGRSVALCDYTRGYELRLPDGEQNFDAVWQQTPIPVDLGKRPSGESISYSLDGTAIFATSEGKKAPVIEVKLQ